MRMGSVLCSDMIWAKYVGSDMLEEQHSHAGVGHTSGEKGTVKIIGDWESKGMAQQFGSVSCCFTPGMPMDKLLISCGDILWQYKGIALVWHLWPLLQSRQGATNYAG